MTIHDHPSSSNADNTNSSKRPKHYVKQTSQQQQEEDAAELPKYGTRQYWDARYKSHTLPALSINNNDFKDVGVIVDGIALTKETIINNDSGHEWYYI
jgi:hypothetical protein